MLVAAAVRMAECMGLHRDGEAYGLTPLETHVRRLVWHQLCFLDIRTCEAQGPRPVIRREDYDTKLPLNCNEEELMATPGSLPPEPSESWTTNTLPLIRFEVNEMMRIIWVDRRRLEMRRTTLTAVLTKIENFRRRMSEKYDHLLDVSLPLQRYAKCVMYLLTYRLHIMILHPYYANALNPMPPRLSHLLVTSGIMVVELAIQLETNPLFQDWAWYLGAFFQYQIALLLATEVYYCPQSREADRIWSCLDYVFGLDRQLPADTKSLQLLSEISNRTAVYARKRKVRGPNSITQATVSTNAVGGVSPSPPGPTQSHAQKQQPPQPQQQQPQPVQQQLHHQPQQHQPSAMDHIGLKSEPSYAPLYNPTEPPSIPPAQPPMVFAGVSDGQVLWGLPPNVASPQGSETSSLGAPGTGAAAAAAVAAATATSAGSNMPQGNIMDTIDWVSLASNSSRIGISFRLADNTKQNRIQCTRSSPTTPRRANYLYRDITTRISVS